MENETSLRHSAFKSIYEEKNPICHIKNPFYFAAKITVTRRIDNINFIFLVTDRYIFSKDGNTPFSFEIIAIHDQFARCFMVFKESTCQQHFIYQRCFAMVNVCDDGNVSYLHFNFLFGAQR